jgi:hypothetical protein
MPAKVAAWLGMQPHPILIWLGAGLLFFAAELCYQISRQRLSTLRALVASTADFLWVTSTIVLLIGFPDIFSTQGKVSLLLVGLVVEVFGTLQLIGIHRIFKLPGTDRYRHCMRFAVTQSAEQLWRSVGDLGAISDYAPFLKDSRLPKGAESGVGAIRTCTNQKNQRWSEECTTYRAGQELTLRFLSEEPGFPLPVETMSGGWTL